MTANGWAQVVVFLGAVLLLTKPLGLYMTRVFDRRGTWLDLIARPVDKKASYNVPGKLFEYLAAGRPILAVAPRGGEIARIIESTGSGMVLSQDGVSELASALSRAIPRLASTGACSPDTVAIEAFERRNLTGRLARVFDDAGGR